YVAYNKDHERQDLRARNALRLLGFTTGKRPTKINKRALFDEYVGLITGSPDINDITTWKNPPKPLSKITAIKVMAKKYSMKNETLFQYLKLYIAAQRRKYGPTWNGGRALLPQLKPR
ncbi:MAG: hypothetical protein NT072_09760, partial [Deltaproteobacteria bacterium]|nr:hypothetical protein [Deltaproteobacteria bacterium]